MSTKDIMKTITNRNKVISDILWSIIDDNKEIWNEKFPPTSTTYAKYTENDKKCIVKLSMAMFNKLATKDFLDNIDEQLLNEEPNISTLVVTPEVEDGQATTCSQIDI